MILLVIVFVLLLVVGTRLLRGVFYGGMGGGWGRPFWGGWFGGWGRDRGPMRGPGWDDPMMHEAGGMRRGPGGPGMDGRRGGPDGPDGHGGPGGPGGRGPL